MLIARKLWINACPSKVLMRTDQYQRFAHASVDSHPAKAFHTRPSHQHFSASPYFWFAGGVAGGPGRINGSRLRFDFRLATALAAESPSSTDLGFPLLFVREMRRRRACSRKCFCRRPDLSPERVYWLSNSRGPGAAEYPWPRTPPLHQTQRMGRRQVECPPPTI